MKKTPLLLLSLLIACQSAMLTTNEPTPTPKIEELTLSQVIDEFSVIDSQLNTTWKLEQIPDKMIAPRSIVPWTQKIEMLKALAQQGLPTELIEARLEMLRAQAAYYTGANIKKGEVKLEMQDNEVKVASINCDNMREIAEATKLYNVAFVHWRTFFGIMDQILQKSKEAREKIGTDENRPAFYKSQFGTAQKRMQAIQDALKYECGFTLNLEDK